MSERAPWRTGRKLGRTLYTRKYSDAPSDDDHFVGIMDTRELAEQVVDAVNAARESAQVGKVTGPGNLSGSLVSALHAELAAIHGVKPEGHSLTGDYAALKPDAERLARVRDEYVKGLEQENKRLRTLIDNVSQGAYEQALARTQQT